MPLSRPQRRVLACYLDGAVADGRAPSFGEVARVLGYRSRVTVIRLVEGLLKSGHLARAWTGELYVRNPDDKPRTYAVAIPPIEWLATRADDEPDDLSALFGELPVDARYAAAERAAWEAIRSNCEPGDELWYFTTSKEAWRQLCGRRGYAIVRDGKIVDGVLTIMN